MPLSPLSTTRDLVHYRKLPGRQQPLLHTVASSFLSLLASPSHPSAASLRTAFLPALLGSESRLDAPSRQRADEQLLGLFSSPPDVVLLQTVPNELQIGNAWQAADGKMSDRVFLGYPLYQELERAKEEDEREEVANLSMMVIATLAFELAQWIAVKVRGYRSLNLSDTASLRTTTTGVSMNSFNTTGSGSPLTPRRNTSDVGCRAVMALLGHDYELLTFSIGERQLVKRRYPTRKSPVLTPPVVFCLIGDTPGIVDATSWPAPTYAGFVPPQFEGDSMYAVTSVLTPAGVARMHGECVVVDGGAASIGGNSVQVNLLPGQDESEDEKGFDPVYKSM